MAFEASIGVPRRKPESFNEGPFTGTCASPEPDPFGDIQKDEHLRHDTTEMQIMDQITEVVVVDSATGKHTTIPLQHKPIDPEDQARYNELRDKIVELSKEMSEKEVRVVTLMLQAPGLKPGDLAAMLNIAPQAADSAWRRAQRRLQPFLIKHGYRLMSYVWEQAIRRRDGICPIRA